MAVRLAPHAAVLARRRTARADVHARAPQNYNFDIQGLVGYDMQLRSVGVVGDNDAAKCSEKLFGAFGCTTTSASPSDDLTELLASSDIVVLHLSPGAAAFDAAKFAQMKDGAVLIASSSAAVSLVDAHAALASGKLRNLGVCTLEEGLALDSTFAELASDPKVLLAGHSPDGSGATTAAAAKDVTEPVVAGSSESQCGTVSACHESLV